MKGQKMDPFTAATALSVSEIPIPQIAYFSKVD